MRPPDNEYDFAINGHITWWDRRMKEFDEGTVILPDATVWCYAQGGWPNRDHTLLQVFLGDGRVYSRSWDHRYSRQYMVTLAKRFVADLKAQTTEAP